MRADALTSEEWQRHGSGRGFAWIAKANLWHAQGLAVGDGVLRGACYCSLILMKKLAAPRPRAVASQERHERKFVILQSLLGMAAAIWWIRGDGAERPRIDSRDRAHRPVKPIVMATFQNARCLRALRHGTLLMGIWRLPNGVNLSGGLAAAGPATFRARWSMNASPDLRRWALHKGAT